MWFLTYLEWDDMVSMRESNECPQRVALSAELGVEDWRKAKSEAERMWRERLTAGTAMRQSWAGSEVRFPREPRLIWEYALVNE